MPQSDLYPRGPTKWPIEADSFGPLNANTHINETIRDLHSSSRYMRSTNNWELRVILTPEQIKKAVKNISYSWRSSHKNCAVV